MLSRIYLEQVLVSKKDFKGIIIYICGSSLTMRDISQIDAMMPHVRRFKRGLGRKYATDIDIWLFAEEVQENDCPEV